MSSLVQILLKKGLIDKDKAQDLESEIKKSGRKEDEIILEKGILPESVLFGAKSEELKIPLKEIRDGEVSLEVLKLIPEETAQFYQMIPLIKKDDTVEIGMVYPEDLKAQEALKFLARQGNFSPEIFLITPSLLNNLLKQYRTMGGEVTEALEELESELKLETVGRKRTKTPELETLVEEAPISRVVATVLKNAVEREASDIHIEPTKEKLRIRFRLDGVLHPVIFLPLKILPAVVSRIKILSNLKIDETRVPQDGRFTTKVNDKEIDFRVSTFPTTLGEKVALRILDPSKGVQEFEKLGLEGRNLEAVKNAIKKPYGLILVTGPTGSGKTTTLYAVLNLLNREGVNIVTLEDPVEYFIGGINQSQVKPEIGYDFASGLRQILRQDPNIIMVGEIRDEETASLAIHAALTGHIVLSTLHTNNALGVIPRLVDLRIKPYLISPSLALAIAQRLVRRLCPDCKKQVKPEKAIEELILKEIEAIPPLIKKDIKVSKPLYLFEKVGCKKCENSGYKGRIAVFEILEMTKNLGEIILKDLSEAKIKEEAMLQGMITMKQDGILKALKGVTTVEEVLRVAEEK